MSSTMTGKPRAHEVLREALRETNASPSTIEAAEEVIAQREAEQRVEPAPDERRSHEERSGAPE